MKTQNGRTQEVDILIRERKDKTNKKYSTKIEKEYEEKNGMRSKEKKRRKDCKE